MMYFVVYCTPCSPLKTVALTMQDKARIDVTRLQRLASGFSNFTVSGLAAESEVAAGTEAAAAASGLVLDDTAKAALRVVFAKDGSYAQEVRTHPSSSRTLSYRGPAFHLLCVTPSYRGPAFHLLCVTLLALASSCSLAPEMRSLHAHLAGALHWCVWRGWECSSRGGK
jgi:hypothetical protein